ncbi:MAG: hypothetical protein JWM76_2726 [Pseudonocardiales bacterium]|nr:hypothetical protein [Pseudonocardiales bacterium]
MIFALVVLVVLLMALLLCWRRPSRVAAFALALLAAAWLTANNGHLEGWVLIVVDPKHGLTAADLISYGSFAVAVHTVLRWARVQAGQAVTPLSAPDPDAYYRASALGAISGLALLLISALAFGWVHQTK